MVSHDVIHHLKTSFSGRWPSHGQRRHLRGGRDHPIIRPIIGDQVYRDQVRHGIERSKPALPEVSWLVMARRQCLICCFRPARLPGFSDIAAKPAKRNGHSAATMVCGQPPISTLGGGQKEPPRSPASLSAPARSPQRGGSRFPINHRVGRGQPDWLLPYQITFFECATREEYVRRVGAHFRMPDQPRGAAGRFPQRRLWPDSGVTPNVGGKIR